MKSVKMLYVRNNTDSYHWWSSKDVSDAVDTVRVVYLLAVIRTRSPRHFYSITVIPPSPHVHRPITAVRCWRYLMTYLLTVAITR